MEDVLKVKWSKPELTILVRTRPEEAILGLCKNLSQTGGEFDKNGQCQQNPPDEGVCTGDCKTQRDS